MWTATKEVKCCANCANWAGERSVSMGKSAVTKDASLKGKCYCGYRDVSEGTAACGSACNGRDFQLWGALRR